MVKLGMISGPFQATLFTVITWNPDSNCTCREKNHFLFRWIFRRDQDYRFILGCDASTPCGRLLEYRRKPKPVRFVDWIHTIHHIGRKNPNWFSLSGEQQQSSLTTCGQRHGKTCQKQRNENRSTCGCFWLFFSIFLICFIFWLQIQTSSRPDFFFSLQIQIWASVELIFITDTDLDFSGINFVIISVSMVLLEKNIDDYWNVDGDRELSDMWTGFTRFTVLNEKPPDGYKWSRGRLTRKQTTSRPDTLWPEIWKERSEAFKRRKKQKWAIEKPKLDNARDGEIKDIMENVRRKLEVPMPAATPCKIQPWKRLQDKIRLHCWGWRIHEKAHGRISSQESRRSYCRKRNEFIDSLQSCATKCSNASSNENTRCKSSSGERMGKTWENTGMAAHESQPHKWGDRWSKEWGQNSSFCIVNGPLSSQEFGAGASVSKYKGRVVLRGDIGKDDTGPFAVFTEQGSSASQKWRLQK